MAPAAALVVGLAPGAALGLVDLVNHSGGYWNGLWHDERSLVYLTLASVVLAAIAIALRRPLRAVGDALPGHTLATAAAVFLLVAAFGAWFVRPRIQVHHKKTLSLLAYERSMIWMSWYLGPITLTAAIVGAALVARAVLRGRLPHLVAPLAVLAPGTVLYLWTASAQADHVWVTRRYLVSAFPTLILLAIGLAAYLWTAPLPSRWTRAGRVGAVAIAVVTVGFPMYTALPVGSMHEQVGYLSVVRDACRIMGPRAAVVVLERPETASAEILESWTQQAFRGWCGAQATLSRYGFGDAATLRRLAREWQARGRRFFVVSTAAAPILALVPDARITPTRRATDRNFLEQTLSHRPHRYQTETFSLVVAAVPPE